MNQALHIPVLSDQVLSLLDPKPGERYLDLTAGYGGHAQSIAHKLGEDGALVLVDRDEFAVKSLEKKFAGDSRVTILRGDFLNISKQLAVKEQQFDVILADIGVSSPHLDNPDRGFSFMTDGPLDMRMDKDSSNTAADIVNNFSKEDLANVLYSYGELRASRSLADRIIRHRPIVTTHELAAIIPGNHKQKMRTLAQVFQALRIAVNDELTQLSESLPLWHKLLAPGGRLAVISFHSLEDRIIKRYFADHSSATYTDDLVSLTKRPLVADQNEIVYNPRSRSAKLRGVQRK